jgi:Phage Tail Collar Domain
MSQPIQYTGGGNGSTAQPLLKDGLPYPDDTQHIAEGAATFRYFADVVSTRTSTHTIPVGAIVPWAGNSTPPGDMWLACDGSGPLDAAKYGDLISVLNGNMLPDLRGMFVLGASNPAGNNPGVPSVPARQTGGHSRIQQQHLPAHGHSHSISAVGSTNHVSVGGGAHAHWLFAQSVLGFASGTTKNGYVSHSITPSNLTTWYETAPGPGHLHDPHGHNVTGVIMSGRVTDFPAGGASGAQTDFIPPYYSLIYIIKALH